MIRRSLLPSAAPGVLTGIFLAVGRAVGETAPLILIGAVTFVTFVPVNPFNDKYTVLPIQIYNWATRPQAPFQEISAADILVLLVMMLVLNLAAIILRKRGFRVRSSGEVRAMQMNDRDPGTQSMVSAIGAVTHINPPSSPNSRGGPALALNGVSCWYGGFRAVRDVQLTIPRNKVTALIGPSGCGKSTLLRSINRMNDLVPSFRMEGDRV